MDEFVLATPDELQNTGDANSTVPPGRVLRVDHTLVAPSFDRRFADINRSSELFRGNEISHEVDRMDVVAVFWSWSRCKRVYILAQVSRKKSVNVLTYYRLSTCSQ